MPPMNLAVAYCVHDDAYYLPQSIRSCGDAAPVFVFVSKLPWNDEPGDWESAARVAPLDWPGGDGAARQAFAALLRRRSAETLTSAPGPAAEPAGNALVGCCGEGARRRWQTLLLFEGQAVGDIDHGFLIGPACQLLESELAWLLVEPARTVAPDLVAALSDAGGHAKQADLLGRWGRGDCPTTLGVGSLVLAPLYVLGVASREQLGHAVACRRLHALVKRGVCRFAAFRAQKPPT